MDTRSGVCLFAATLVLAATPVLAQTPRDVTAREAAASQVAQQRSGAPAAPAKPAQKEAETGETGTEWVRSETGWRVPDPTGTRFFKPAISGGSGVFVP